MENETKENFVDWFWTLVILAFIVMVIFWLSVIAAQQAEELAIIKRADMILIQAAKNSTAQSDQLQSKINQLTKK